MVDVSVIVCSYNRAESLRDTIESLVNQRAMCSYEIIVVDNNSKDGTRDVAESFNGKVKYAFESRQGLSYARNTGIKEAKGQIIAFTDDDVIADSNWVSSIYQCFKETRAIAVGGQIKRLWNCERPEWLAEEIMGPLIVQDLGPQRKKWDQQNRHMIGANMSFHRAIFEQHGIFREALGRKGDRLIGGEDREIFQRLQKAGIAIFYEPKAIVHHKVEKQRLSKDFMRQWFWEVGRTLGHEIQWKWKFIFTAAPIWLWRDLTRALRRLMRAHFEPGVHETEKFVSQLWVLHYGGRFFERFLHWLPFGLGKGLCAFKEEIKENGNTK